MRAKFKLSKNKLFDLEGNEVYPFKVVSTRFGENYCSNTFYEIHSSSEPSADTLIDTFDPATFSEVMKHAKALRVGYKINW